MIGAPRKIASAEAYAAPERARKKAVESRLEYCQRKAAETRARAEAMKDFEDRRVTLEAAAM